jgi:hypothetical protein
MGATATSHFLGIIDTWQLALKNQDQTIIRYWATFRCKPSLSSCSKYFFFSKDPLPAFIDKSRENKYTAYLAQAAPTPFLPELGKRGPGHP